MQQPFWNFPAAAGGTINSINNAGIETFRGNELDSLTREICQNSLDAVKDESQPVIVEFKKFNLKNHRFPERNELIQAFDKCETTWKGKNAKIEQFVDQAKYILGQAEIPFLRISDFNTKGLEGAQTGELGTPWSSLVREAGSSNKGDSSGGSFGIGKSAPFANSKLRTLFYSSYDLAGYQSHIGVANIMSFEKEANFNTLGTGYYTNHDNSTAIPSLLNLDSTFERKETGTDIEVVAFEPKDNWVEAMRNSVIYNFFITIWQKKLVVKVEDEVISHENIGPLIASLDDTNEDYRHVKAYFNLLTSQDAIQIPYPAKEYKKLGKFEEGEASLYIMKGEDLNRRVLMTRKAGMRLFEQNRISGSISFTGVLIITGKHMNQVFKQMENPAHTGWEPNRIEEAPKEAAKAFSDLRKFVRETVQQQFQAETTDMMDAFGLSDFLPDTTTEAGEGEEKKESLTMKIKTIVQKKKEKPKKKLKKKQPKENFEEELQDAGITPEGDLAGHTNEDRNEGQGEGGGSGNQHGEQGATDEGTGGAKDGKGEKEKNKPVDAETRYICMQKDEGLYRVNFKPDKKFEKGKLEFKVVGEQSEYILPVISVESIDIEIISIDKNAVRFINLTGKKPKNIQVKVDYEQYCVLEVDLYEI
ncbi:hypothetical protein [Lysinibacillus sp. SGAir0095]|uniref:hypothetical protein n=1 Tax=Lysinibacillus sp. SGAir0095 TaxID=2070463 RepID=UPI0010CCE752|nr:hypothetical protein [Lysinibacillus sp. SGAir0095]QCR31031.1 hypothetical protein C1N55_02120 [Lysinibacillus sp. SGAir0095]